MIFSSWFKSAHLESFEKELLSTNLVGAKTLNELFTAERKITSVRQEKLQEHPLEGNFDYEHLKAIHRELFQDVYVWAGHDRYSTGYRNFFNQLNILHPFIEGNGRTQRLFIEDLAKNSGYKLNLSKVSQDDMIQASMEGATGDIKSFKAMIEERLTFC
jgi:cell filamentation protein